MTSSARLSLAFALVLAAPGTALAATTAICDGNGTFPVADGVIGSSEYAGFSTGVNMGFGDMIGTGVRLYADADATGRVAFAIDATGHACTWGTDDSVVIYIDSTANGFTSTATLTDNADGGRAAISGNGTGGGTSVLTFAQSFAADYAIVLRNDSASLFQLNTGSLTFVRSLTRGPTDWSTNPCVREVVGATLTDLGSTGSFHYVATLINASNAVRSDELQGVSSLTFTQAAAPMTLPADGFNVFSRVSSVQTLTPAAPYEEHFCAYAGAGLAPTPTAGQLDSDLWRATGFSDGNTTFGGTFAPATPNDWNRGVGADSATTGGMYAFRSAPPERGFGVQPGGSDVDPGDFDLRLANTQTVATTTVNVSYDVYYLNNQGHSGTISLQYSTDGTTFVTTPTTLDVVTPLAADMLGWTLAVRTTSLAIAVPAGGSLTLRWHHVTTGSGSRDKFAIDDVVVTPTFPPVCGNNLVETGETCDGTTCCSASCTYAAEFTSCGPAGSGACDMADTCNATGTCVDRVMGSGVSCRTSRDLCDAEELCDGVSSACPADARVPANTPCRPSSGQLCDVPDICDGLHDACTDAFAPSTTTCAAGTPPCDLGASCTGTSAACPADTLAGDGTSCDDGLACNGTSTCQSGTCTMGVAVGCDDGNRCTSDSCMDPSGTCLHGPIAGCCNSAMDCDDTNLCTTDVCGGSATCSHTTISGCCLNDAGCSDGDVCTTDSCPTAGGSCSFAPITGCCHAASDCNDGLSCTTDACNTTTHTCTHVSIPSCCTTATDCNDSNACTTDSCAAGGTCTNAPIANCCLGDGDCGDANSCTTDTCDTTTHTCGHAAITNCCHAGDSCDDSDFCTDDACSASERCTHTAHSCDDANACTTDTCSAGACHHASSCVDAGTDAGNDAGNDAGTDAGTDAGVDGGSDAGTDAAVDVDAGVDASTGDAGIDAAVTGDASVAHDAAVDAGDAGHDAGRDSGPHDGSTTSPDVGSTPPPASSCACRANGASGSFPLGPVLGGLGLALVVSRRRRRR